MFLFAFSQGPPAAHTGAFGEPACTVCHTTFPLNPSGGSVVIARPEAYTPGAEYPITVTIHDSAGSRARWGFQLTARFGDGRQAGSFTAGPNTSVRPFNSVEYLSHNPAQRLQGNSFTYTVTWKAPPDLSGGDVLFHAAGNAANGDGTNLNDRIFTTGTVSAPATGAAARINSGGIVNAASFVSAPNNYASPGALISIFGQNLANSQAFAASLPLPTTLGGAQVLINNVAAPLIFVSPGQINAQAPFEVATGTASTFVRVAGRPDSAAEQVLMAPVAPGIFTTSQNGTGPGAILKQDTVTPVSANAPALVGETIIIFCNGLGQTQSPALETGKAGAGQRTLQTPTVTIGGRDARVDFSGAAPGFAGLYQINAVVPMVSTGDQEVIIRFADGRESRAGVTVRVQ